MGVVSDHLKFLFVHIPKNGGLSVYEFVRPSLMQGDVVVMEGAVDPRVWSETVVLEKHTMAYEWHRWFAETGRDWDAYKTFAVLRDPLARPQSVYNEIGKNIDGWVRHDAGEEWVAEFKKCHGVEDFVMSGLYAPDGPLNITYRQWDFVRGHQKVIVSDLILLETLWWSLPSLLELPGQPKHYHPGQYVPTELSRTAKAQIHRLYADDFALIDQVKRRLNQ